MNPITLLNNFQSNVIPSNSRYANPRAGVITNFRPTQVVPYIYRSYEMHVSQLVDNDVTVIFQHLNHITMLAGLKHTN